MRSVIEGRLDIGIVAGPVQTEALHAIPCRSDSLVLVVAKVRQPETLPPCRRDLVDVLVDNAPRAVSAQSKAGSTSSRSAPRAASKWGTAERTTSQNAGLWFISRRWASSWATT